MTGGICATLWIKRERAKSNGPARFAYVRNTRPAPTVLTRSDTKESLTVNARVTDTLPNIWLIASAVSVRPNAWMRSLQPRLQE